MVAPVGIGAGLGLSAGVGVGGPAGARESASIDFGETGAGETGTVGAGETGVGETGAGGDENCIGAVEVRVGTLENEFATSKAA